MNSVSKVIFDALVARQRVVLPGVGSLEVKRKKAKRISDTRILPPQNVVLFSTKEPDEADTVSDLLVDSGGVSRFEAGPLYDSWLEGARTGDGDGLIIEEVGELLPNGEFIAAQPLHSALNPANEEDVVTMEKENKGTPVWMWLLVGILLAAVIFLLIWSWKKGAFECSRDKDRQTEAVAPVPAPDAIPGEGFGEVTGVGGNAGDAVTDVVPAVATGPESESGTATGQPRYHVIAGAFSVESNADKFIGRIKRNHPELTPEKIYNPANGYTMVSIFNAPSERQANNKVSMYWDIDLNLWVYQQN